MGRVGQFLISSQTLDRTTTKKIVEKVVRENKDIAQAVDAVVKTKSTRGDAVLEVIKRNPAIQKAIARELLAARKK
jgi:hypothetical protein